MSYILRLVNHPGFVLGSRLEFGTIETSIDTHRICDTQVYESKELAKRARDTHFGNLPTFLFEIHELPQYILVVYVSARAYVLQATGALVLSEDSTNARKFDSHHDATVYAINNFKGSRTDVSEIDSEF